jgi:hypothetical protein
MWLDVDKVLEDFASLRAALSSNMRVPDALGRLRKEGDWRSKHTLSSKRRHYLHHASSQHSKL